MKSLSVKQPWANWIANGRKTIETRRWATSYRGPLLICSSKEFDHDTAVDERAALYPLGFALCIVDLVDVRMMEGRADEDAALCGVYPGARAWVLANPRKIEPFSVKGRLGLFEVSLPLIEAALAVADAKAVTTDGP